MIEIRITKSLFEKVKQNLLQPHPFALERIGFLLGKMGNKQSDSPIILLYDYLPVEDDDYLDSNKGGAVIGTTAIRKILSHTLSTGDVIFHTHLHENMFKPYLSKTDKASIPPLVKSFQNASPHIPHGIFLYSLDSCTALILMPSSDSLLPVSKIKIIGFPTVSIKEDYE